MKKRGEEKREKERNKGSFRDTNLLQKFIELKAKEGDRC